ncbi:MAG: gamma-glutamylcyclotransferase [Oleibacter sp.]|nr:gamma-glutamylcyclotransferase [Thalassolituus sp.]
MITPKYLFVYGSLRPCMANTVLPGGGIKARAALSQWAEYVAPATWQARLYKLSGYPGAVASENASDHVIGDVFRVTDAHLWSVLDQYELCGPDDPTPHEYRRSVVLVELTTEPASSLSLPSLFEVQVYQYIQSTVDVAYLPHGDWSLEMTVI